MTDEAPLNFRIEVTPLARADVLPEMDTDKYVQATRKTLQEVSQVIEESTQAFVSSIAQLAHKPNEIEIEFGVEVGGEAGVPFVTKGTVQANFKIALKWTL